MKKSRSSRQGRRKGTDPAADLRKAIGHHEAGRLAEAAAACRRALSAQPDWPQALHVLAVICFRAGEQQQAVEHLHQAVALDRTYLPGYNDLGNMLHELGRLKEAVAVFTALSERQPDNARTLNNLGVVLKDDGQTERAVAVLERAVALDPDHLHAHLNLGYALLRAEAHPEAIASFREAARLDPNNAEPYRALARIYRLLRDDDQALAAYRQWQGIEPDNPVVRHMLTAYTAEEAPPRAADDYVREEFDRFAESFDEKLSSLNYRAPQLVGEAVARHHSAPDGSLVVLDVGCGTGLGGLLLRPYAARLSGVDLSPEMLARARDRGVYDDLAEMELVAYLGGHPRAFDLVTVIDTFVYFGDLAPPLAACAAALRPGGSLAFTVEAAPEPQTTFRLDRSGRYVHGREYVESCLDRAGFGRREIDSVALREEGGQPVGGLLVWAGL